MKMLILVLMLAPVFANAQTATRDNLWLAFKPMIGKWTGEAEGKGGKGKFDRSYEFVLNGKFIEVKNKSAYPSGQVTRGEVHEDRAFVSYDKTRKTFVLRRFRMEGFVNQYKIELISPDKKLIVFKSENIENIPSGFRAREIYQFVNENEFVETFEMAEPGKDFEVYSKVRLKRVH
jgi:hypothetical protein